MTQSIFFFKQYVAKDGYKITTPDSWKEYKNAPPSDGQTRPSVVTANLQSVSRVTYPLDTEPSLFTQFAGTELSEEGVLKFANQYGLIGRYFSATTSEHGKRTVDVEPLDFWYDEITEMKRAAHLAQLLQQGDTKGLSKIIEWVRDPKEDSIEVHYKPDGRRPVIVMSNSFNPDLLERAAEGSVELPDRVEVQIAINKKYEKYVSPQLLFDKDYGKQSQYIVPKNLLGVMWLQLARAYENNKPYRVCKLCLSPFVVEKERGNKRLFCSDACKSMNYRKSKGNA